MEVLCERVSVMELEPGYRFEKVPVFWAYGPVAVPVRLRAA
jgi:hypothetical protein